MTLNSCNMFPRREKKRGGGVCVNLFKYDDDDHQEFILRKRSLVFIIRIC